MPRGHQHQCAVSERGGRARERKREGWEREKGKAKAFRVEGME